MQVTCLLALELKVGHSSRANILLLCFMLSSVGVKVSIINFLLKMFNVPMTIDHP